ncbi:hypothetical protein D3C78_1516180 [compost metagenome]
MYLAASTTVAICVLSPISARKKATSVVPKTPQREAEEVSSSSSLSGISIHTAMPMKHRASTQRRVCGPRTVVTQAPAAPARAWLASVAARMPSTMGQGLRKRAARTSARSCVLSPISAMATMAVETKKASMGCL